jgi:hypothetical protein
MLSTMKELDHTHGATLLNLVIVYYYQQLNAGGVLEIIRNIIQNQEQVAWAKQVSQSILTKYPTLTIPPYRPAPPHSKKIKYRSVGIKKQEMIQFT